jgi:LAO/AO transport system kinase
VSGEEDGLSATQDLLRRLEAKERRALAQLLSMAESTKPSDERFLAALFSEADVAPPSLRIGVTGIPGAGKSTLIDAFGSHLVAQGKHVAVLAVDPSSPVSGGSILGDKLRMPRLLHEPAAFVRPLANRGVSGGGVYALEDCVRLCELAGYDVVIVETVGVGQNEVDVGLVCDVTLLVVVPGTGDEVQALKRGITEVVDIIAVNKCDLAGDQTLHAVEHGYRDGLSYLRRPSVPVVTCSAVQEIGIDKLSEALVGLAPSGTSYHQRAQKRQLLLRRMVEQALLRRLWTRLEQTPEFAELSAAVGDGRASLRQAIEEVLALTEISPGLPKPPRDQC